jgi:protein TonB
MGVGAVRIFRNSFSVSLSLHILFGLLCFLVISRQPVTHTRDLTWIEVEPSVPAQKKTQDEQNKNQIVQTEKARRVDKAVPNAYLGEQNQVVDRESVSANKMTAMTQKQAAHKAQAVAQAAPAVPVIGNLGVQILPKQTQPKTDEEIAHQENWADQASAPQDYVKGIREANRTALNTKEFVFFTYYQRIRQRLDNAWIPILRERVVKFYESGRHLASDSEHTTKVLVLLNPQGEITTVKIVSESGTAELDDSAVAAFNQAGPFPNPPKGIVGPSGLIEIPWEFILRT